MKRFACSLEHCLGGVLERLSGQIRIDVRGGIWVPCPQNPLGPLGSTQQVRERFGDLRHSLRVFWASDRLAKEGVEFFGQFTHVLILS
jgi:hypothetical protein